MKNEQIQEFFTKVAQDEGFKAEVLKFKEEMEAKKLNEQDVQKFVGKVLLPKAKKLGYDFSEKDLADFGNSQGLANLDKLSLEEMKNVSGGVNKGFLGAMFSLAMFMGVGAGVGMSASAAGPNESRQGTGGAKQAAIVATGQLRQDAQARALAEAAAAAQGDETEGDIVTPAHSGPTDRRESEVSERPNKRRKLANGTASEAEQPQQSGNPAQGEKRRKTTNSSGNRVVQSRGVDRTRRPGQTRGAIRVMSQNHHIQNDSRCEITGTGETFIQGNGITTVSGNGRTDVAGEGAVNVLSGGTGKVSFVDDAQKEQVSLQRKHDLISLSLPGAGKFSIEGKISVSNTQLPNGQRFMQVSYDDTTDLTHPEHIFMMQFLRDGTSFLVTRNWHSTFRSLCNAVSSNAGGLTRESAKAALSDNAVKAFLFQLFANAGIDTADKMTEYFSHIVKNNPALLNHVIDQKKTWTVRQDVQRQQQELLRRNIIFLEAKQRGVQQLLKKSDEELGQQQREALQSQNQAIEKELQKLRGVNPPH